MSALPTRLVVSRRTAGQTLVLGCLTMLMLAMMMLTSFTMANAVHERIRLQASADASAYSMAVVEARAFNTLAYQNRAIAAAIVAEMSMHNWYMIAQWDASLYLPAAVCMGLIALEEIAQVPYFNFQHIPHAIQAGIAAVRLAVKGIQLMNKANGLKSKLRDATKAFSTMIKDIHSDQKQIVNGVLGVRTQLGLVLNKVHDTDNKNVSLSAGSLGHVLTNYNRFKDAIATGNGGSSRGDIMMKAARDSSPGWVEGGWPMPMVAGKDYSSSILRAAGMGMMVAGIAGTSMPAFPATGAYNPEDIRSICGDTGNFIWAGMSPVASTGSSSGRISTQFILGGLIVQWRDGVMAMVTFAPGLSTSGSDYNNAKCDDDNNCFTNYKGSTSGDMNQPTVYSSETKDLRLMRNGQKGKWELNDDGAISVRDGSQELNFTFVPQHKGYAVSKAKAYFHQIGGKGWKVPPNLFDPFWRAKLHPFDNRQELLKVAGLSGDTRGITFVGGSVEGK